MTTAPASKPIGTLLSEVQPEAIEWLWKGRIPLGKITILDGDPGLGKSLLTLDIAARVSTGREMPDGTPGRRGGVVLATGEDGLADTIRPRLDAAGADVSQILDISFANPEKSKLLRVSDLAMIELAVKRVSAILVVIDPLPAFLGENVKTGDDASVRLELTPLSKMAERLRVAIILSTTPEQIRSAKGTLSGWRIDSIHRASAFRAISG